MHEIKGDERERWKGLRKNIDATVIFREKILDEFQPLREGFKQESVKKN